MKPEDIQIGRVYKGSGAIRYRQVVELLPQYGEVKLLWVAPPIFPGRDTLPRCAPLQGRVTNLRSFAKWSEREVDESELSGHGDV